MAKIKVIKDINMRHNGNVVILNEDSYIEISESMAIYLCNEDIQENQQKRIKHAIRTPQEEQNNNHKDYTHI